jgi:hypothetical protein
VIVGILVVGGLVRPLVIVYSMSAVVEQGQLLRMTLIVK